jgi:hypothetical protein
VVNEGVLLGYSTQTDSRNPLSQGRLFIVLLFSACTLLASDVPAATLRVPEDFPSILTAVDAATAGDSVLVGPGTWTDREVRLVQVGPNLLNIVSCAFLKPGISVIGVYGAEETIVDGGPQDVATQVTFLHNLLGISPVKVEGFTIHAGNDAFVVTSPSPIEIIACHIEDCWDRAAGIGRAIGAAPCDVTLEDCIVRSCGHEGNISGAINGIGKGLDCDLKLRNTRFETNPSLLGAVNLHNAHSIIVDECEFADHQGRAMSLVDVAEVSISHSLFLRNSTPTSSGGAIAIANCQSGLIEFCTFAYDSALSGQAGGVDMQFSNISVNNSTFYACYAPLIASALRASGVVGVFERNIVANSSGGPALRRSAGDFIPNCNDLWANEGGDFYGDWVPSPTDIFADPLFCDPEVEDWTVDVKSPCTPENSLGCGLIGALGQGCGAIAVESKSWGQIKGLYR